MLIRISTRDARLGMFVDHIEGSWADNPFWKRRFKLEEPRDLARLQDSPIDTVFIDLNKGRGPDERDAAKPTRHNGDAKRVRIALSRATDLTRELFTGVSTGDTLSHEAVNTVVAQISGVVRDSPLVLLNMTRLKERDNFSYLHSIGVCALAMHFARHLGMGEPIVREIAIGAFVHDIGKTVIATEILSKPGRLNEDEMTIMRTHPARGHAILQSDPRFSDTILDICLRHHECLDGRGYPAGLKGTDISVPVRITSICDVYDAMTSIRPYKNAWKPKTALETMQASPGQFDQALLAAFAACLRDVSAA